MKSANADEMKSVLSAVEADFIAPAISSIEDGFIPDEGRISLKRNTLCPVDKGCFFSARERPNGVYKPKVRPKVC